MLEVKKGVAKAAKFAPVVVMGLVMASPVFAQVTIDVTDAEAGIAAANTAIAAIGGGLIGLAAVAMAYRWVKATFF